MSMAELKSNIIVRRPTEADFEEMKRFIAETCEHTRNFYGVHDWDELFPVGETYGEIMERIEKGNILLGTVEGVLSGIVVLTQRKSEKFRHVGNLTVSLRSDDLMATLGKELIGRMILACKSKGVIRKINLRVREDLEVTKEVYKFLGFYEEGVLARDICLNGMFYSTILYGRSID